MKRILSISISVFLISCTGIQQNKFEKLKNSNKIGAYKGDAPAYFEARKVFKKANKEAEKNNRDNALTLVNSALDLDSTYVEALVLQADLLRKTGGKTASVTALEKAVGYEPDDTTAVLELGIAYRRVNEYEKSLEQFKHLVYLRPNENNYWEKAYTEKLAKNYDACLEDYNKAIELNANNEALIAHRGECKKSAGDISGAKRDFETALEMNSRSWVANYNMAMLDFDDEDYENASKKFFSAFFCNPSKRQNYYMLGRSYYHQENYESAIGMFAVAIAFDSTETSAYFKRGECYEKMDSTVRAIEDYTSCIKLDSTDSWAYNKRAELFLRESKKDSACFDFLAAVRLGNTENIKSARSKCGEQEVKKALALDSVALKVVKSGYRKGIRSDISITGFNNKKFEIQTETDSIPMKIGSQFGLEYSTSFGADLPGKNLTITWIFPEGAKDKEGKELKESSHTAYKANNDTIKTWFMLEYEHELVKGDWYYTLSIDGVEFLRKKFVIY